MGVQRAINTALKDEARRWQKKKKDTATEKKRGKGELQMMWKEENEQRRFAKWLHRTTVQALRAGLSEKKNKQKEEQQMRKWWAERKAFVDQSDKIDGLLRLKHQ